MPRPALKDGLTKQARYRAAKKAAGLKEVRLWTFDTKDPAFLAQLKREMTAIRESPAETDDIAFVEALTDWPAEDK
ncbi:hypothetical protein IP69_17760 [Bosea sp. AAP35]|uniref:antitoxin MazE-like protein n=1 Tax=Bosea sp. AAP35 TaxID=1523417 RepID=UPI0006B96701|nr:antitoxin MazE-like protein [Bosea sp. AAP35]KPF65541.1 hypothetical protein IP69_17760 [Bosea sp. AAP35]